MNSEPTNIPTPRTDAAWRSFSEQGYVQDLLEFTRTLEYQVSEFCTVLGFPITVGDNAGTANEKLCGALDRAKTLERENIQLREQSLKLQALLNDKQIGNRLFSDWLKVEKERDDLKAEVESLKQWLSERPSETLYQNRLDQIFSLEKQVMEMREALKTIQEKDGPGLDLSPAGVFHPIAHIALSSTPQDLSRKWVRREVLEKCAEALNSIHWISNWKDISLKDEALTAAQKELEK